jgi:hypothetical protein
MHSVVRRSPEWAIGLSALTLLFSVASPDDHRWTAVVVLLLADAAGVTTIVRAIADDSLPRRKRAAAFALGTVPLLLTLCAAALVALAWIVAGTG